MKDKRCKGTKVVNGTTYRCVLEAYHGGNCHFCDTVDIFPKHVSAERAWAHLRGRGCEVYTWPLDGQFNGRWAVYTPREQLKKALAEYEHIKGGI